MSKGRRRRSDLDQHRQQTHIRLILGGFSILVLVGGGLVWLLYGRLAGLTTAACLLMAASLFGLLWLILRFLEILVQEDEP